MISANSNITTMIGATLRQIDGRVGLKNSTTTYNSTDLLKNFKVERIGQQGKIIGFGICQKLTFTLLDKNSAISISKGRGVQPQFGVNSSFVSPFPTFYIEESERDENNGDITFTCYDKLATAATHTVAELSLAAPYTIGGFVAACAALLGVSINTPTLTAFSTNYPTGANFEGTETIREALDAAAAATQTIYYIDSNDRLTFKRLDAAGNPVAVVGKSKYYTLTSKASIKPTSLAHITELGDNISTGAAGVDIFVRNNPFWELREDINTLVNNAFAAVKDIVIYPFTCDWRGNFLFEIGDKLAFTTKDNTNITTYLLDDTIDYDGALSQKTQWEYKEEGETASNPTSLGDIVKQTYAKVDKANKRVDIVASEVGTYSSSISSLQITTDEMKSTVESVEEEVDTVSGEVSAHTTAIAALNINTQSISASVSETQEQVKTNKENNDTAIETLTKKVDTKVSADEVNIAITTQLENGVDKVETKTGFTFNDAGLNISKSNSEISTQISENGMAVSRSGAEVLTANNTGVKAENLHATTYLVIGSNSRFEDYDGSRTGCFWIGG